MRILHLTGGKVVAAGCVYELIALNTPLPTITTIIKQIGKHPLGRIAVWGWCGFISWHFLEPS